MTSSDVPSIPPLQVLYEDNHCLAVVKPPRLLIAADRTGDPNLLDLAKEYIKQKYQKPGNVFLGLVHRLDRPVSGVVLFARTSKAAARLSEQFRTRSVQKRYRAVVSGVVPAKSGELQHWLLKDPETNQVHQVKPQTPGGLAARLKWTRIATSATQSLLEIQLETGRSHQIRAQLAWSGFPILGDLKYGSQVRFRGSIALHASRLTFEHPITGETITLEAPTPTSWPLT